MDRTILHCDINNCYASIECLLNPDLQGRAMVVAGSEKDRHGIVLSKTESAKKYGICTGEPISKARLKCKHLIVVPPKYDEYTKYTSMCKEIYYNYTNNVESFGLDEAWLDCTGSKRMFGDGMKIANSIRKKIYSEVGVTISVGVSFNKIFAKLGSDLKKPNAITEISKENFKEKIWNLNVSNLLYVGKATSKTLYSYGIYTIGDLANTDIKFIENILGKNGEKIHKYANGEDQSAVYDKFYKLPVKSISRGSTFKKDLIKFDEIMNGISELSTRVSNSLIDENFLARTIEISLRDNNLRWYSFRKKISRPINTPTEIIKVCKELISNRFIPYKIRAISIKGTDLTDCKTCYQINVSDYIKNNFQTNIADKLMYNINKKYNKNMVFKGNALYNNYLSNDIPESFKMPAQYHS